MSKSKDYNREKQHFASLIKIGDFYKHKSKMLGTNIGLTSLYTSKEGKFYIADVIPFTKFQKYWLWEVTKEALEIYLNKKDNKKLRPKATTYVYEINAFDKKVLTSISNHIFAMNWNYFLEDRYASEDEYGCEDEYLFKQYINIT